MTAAVVQAMPIQPRGIHVDAARKGVSHYWMRNPGDLTSSVKDILERKRSVATIYAAWIAERKFYPSCPDDGWGNDRDKVRLLLEEIHGGDCERRRATAEDLWHRAEKLVDEFYPVIEALAKTLLAKPFQILPAEERNAQPPWTDVAEGRSMSGDEVRAFYDALLPQAKAECRELGEGTFNSADKAPLFDIFAL